jgi:single-strand DNA-binding protein
MAYELTGKVKLVGEAQTFGGGFTKREVVVTVDDGKFPQDITFEFLQDKVSLLDNVTEGQELRVFFDLRGRYSEKYDRHFNSVVGWKVESIGETVETPSGSGEADRPALPPESVSNEQSGRGYPVDWDDEDPPF